MTKTIPPNSPCPCQSGHLFAACCQPLLTGTHTAPTALALMRSRYTAYVLEDSAYLRHTWHPSTCPAVVDFTPGLRWLGLKIIASTEGGEQESTGMVEFRARYKLSNGQGHALQECSQFYRLGDRWVYLGERVDKTT